MSQLVFGPACVLVAAGGALGGVHGRARGTPSPSPSRRRCR
ncbi:hypothetical protein [Microbispora catharanthi]|nr:hypothetical protein [Microbispora catharanthi]